MCVSCDLTLRVLGGIVTVWFGVCLVLWLFGLVCVLCCGCLNWFCNVWVCVCFVMCGYFDNCVGILVISVLVFTVFCTVLYSVFVLFGFIYIYSYLFCLYQCKDCCHRVTTQLQL